MNDDEMLTAMRSSLTSVKDSLDEVRFDRPVSSITGKARGRKLQRGLSAAAAGGLALGVGLAFGLSGGGQAASKGVHVNLDGFSVNTSANGLVDVTISELKHPAVLRRVLAEAGIPAIVNIGRDCFAGPSLPEIRQVVVRQQATHAGVLWVLNPAAMPAGARLDMSFSADILSPPAAPTQGTSAHPEQMVAASVVGLVKDGAPLTCTPFPWVPVHRGG